jgi:hypothetical protein
LSTPTSTEQQKGEDSVFDTAGQAQSAGRVALFWLMAKLQTLSKVTGAPVAELVRRAIDVYLEQRKAEIKNA